MSYKKANIGFFAREILKRPLYPYQEIIGNRIIESVLNGEGLTFTVMMARQMGKNQLSAILECYLLSCMESGTIVKCAPTFKPQVINSRLRLLTMLENDLTANRVFKSFGYIIGVAPTPQQRRDAVGPRIMMFSAEEGSSVVGATASLLLEVDEAQDVSPQKFDRDFRPMASTTNATTVLYGTAWSNDTLLEMTKQHNLELEAQDGIKRQFEYTWRELAKYNDNYCKFVEAEIERLGPEHITIRTQYELQPISGAGFLLNELQRHMIKGSHDWVWGPEDEDYIVAGIDVGGEEDRTKPGEEMKVNKRDSTVITIARVGYNEFALPALEVIHQYWWTGKEFLEQYAMIVELAGIWGMRKIVIDRTGLGNMMASMLQAKLGEDRVQAFNFTRQSKSELTFHFLSLVNSGRLKIYAPDEAPPEIYAECIQQLHLARYTIPGEGLLSMHVLPHEGHDDMLISVALCCEAIREFETPVQEAQVIKPRPMYRDGRY
jgi:hypothetical protein